MDPNEAKRVVAEAEYYERAAVSAEGAVEGQRDKVAKAKAFVVSAQDGLAAAEEVAAEARRVADEATAKLSELRQYQAEESTSAGVGVGGLDAAVRVEEN